MTKQTALKPLAGIRVLDFTAFPPGGCCTVMLADLGAEVIRVESPKLKGRPSLVVGQQALGRGKRSITLDLRNPAATDILLKLFATVDVVVENAKPGVMQQRGHGYSQASAVKPDIIWCAITGFGQSGPYAEHAGHDLSYLAHSGVLSALSVDGQAQPAIPLALQTGALSAVIGIQSALLQRQTLRAPAFIDISLSEAAGWLLNGGINAFSDNPLLLPATADRRLYTCADGERVAIACAEPRTWNALCEALQLDELKPCLHQREHDQQACDKLTEAFAAKPAAEWVAQLAPAGVAITAVNHASQVAQDPHVQARGSLAYIGKSPVAANPVRVTMGSATTTTNTDAPHQVGEDNHAVLAATGFDRKAIQQFEADGLI